VFIWPSDQIEFETPALHSRDMNTAPPLPKFPDTGWRSCWGDDV